MPMLPEIIATERLTIRAVTPDFADAQAQAVNDSKAELSQWMSWAQDGQSPDQARENLTRSADDFTADRAYAYAFFVGDEFAGRVGVEALDRRIPKGEIGYWTRTMFAGQGYCQEATKGLIDAMLTAGFRRIEIRCDALNHASATVARKVGATQDACFVNDDVSAVDPSMLRDTLVFSITQ